MASLSNSARDLRLPDFIGVGPGRTGTTWIHEVLKGRVNLPAGIKETDFFTTNYYKGIEWYAHHFRNADRARPTGEINPYFGFPEAAERIATHIPGCKIICTFRNPVERIYSAYKLWRHYTLTKDPLEVFLVKVPQVIEVTRYATHLRRFPRAVRRRPRDGPAQRRPARRAAGLSRSRLRFRRHRALSGAAFRGRGRDDQLDQRSAEVSARGPQGAPLHVLARRETSLRHEQFSGARGRLEVRFRRRRSFPAA